MGKLTIEQKANRYDIAVELAAKFKKEYLNYKELNVNKNVIEAFDNIFSESKESEDEKIKKCISDVIKEYNREHNWPHIFGVTKDDCLAWLEKQGEQELNDDEDILQRFSFYSYKDEPNILYLSGLYVNSEHRSEGIGTNILATADKVAESMGCNYIRLKTEIGSDAERLYRRNGYNTLKIEDNQVWLEKRCDVEKKELEKIENKKPLLSDFFKAEYERGKADAQKYTEWSKANKHGFENCLYAIKETFKGEDNPHRVGTINWLKSLQDRVQLQPKQEEVVLYWESGHPEPHKSVLILRHGNVVVEGEWDEETKRWYQYGWQSYLEDNEVEGWIDKKSLLGNFNFQNHWKPSDEQMYILDQWLKDNQYNGDARYCYPIIDSLYQDLKKLKE